MNMVSNVVNSVQARSWEDRYYCDSNVVSVVKSGNRTNRYYEIVEERERNKTGTLERRTSARVMSGRQNRNERLSFSPRNKRHRNGCDVGSVSFGRKLRNNV